MPIMVLAPTYTQIVVQGALVILVSRLFQGSAADRESGVSIPDDEKSLVQKTFGNNMHRRAASPRHLLGMCLA